MVTHWLFTGFVVLLGVQRLLEMRLSQKNERVLLSLGGREHAPGQFRWMKLMHTAWLIAMPAEVLLLDRPFIPALSLAALAFMAAGQVLRYAAIRALGPRWTVRVMTLPEAPPVQGGIYRFIRHPNYLGVILEIAAAPLLHSAFITAVLFSTTNALLLAARIRAEEDALQTASSYLDVFEHRPRFFPYRSLNIQRDHES